MTTHSSVLAWRIPGAGDPDGLPSMGLHRVGHDWSDLAAAAAVTAAYVYKAVEKNYAIFLGIVFLSFWIISCSWILRNNIIETSQVKVFIALNAGSQTPFQRFYFPFFFINLVYQLSLSLNSIVFPLSTCLLSANPLAGGRSTPLGWPTLWPHYGGCGCRKAGDQGKREKRRKCTDFLGRVVGVYRCVLLRPQVSVVLCFWTWVCFVLMANPRGVLRTYCSLYFCTYALFCTYKLRELKI